MIMYREKCVAMFMRKPLILKTTGAEDDCSLGRVFDRQNLR